MSIPRVICLNCIDGRTQLPVINWIKETYQVEYVDMITEAGMDGFLADNTQDIHRIIRTITISIEKNNATMIFVVGHYDCKGNPVDEATHKKHTRAAVERVKKEFSSIDVVGVWLDSNWQAKAI